MTKQQKRIARRKKDDEQRKGRSIVVKDRAKPTGDTLEPAPARQGSRSRSRLGGKKSRKERKEKKPKVGLFVTKELTTAIETTKSTVERIAKECRLKNKRYRDLDFDLEYDAFRCLHGYDSENSTAVGKDVQRVTEIFDHPEFFPPGGAAQSASIRQGSLGDCYFLSGLATVSGLPGLIEKICVARDEEVGIYGFIFYQDRGWVGVIVDDMLYTSIPKYEELSQSSKEVYHEDKEQFNAIARKGGQTLIYAKAGTSNDTWVPIIEKAYAKLYGCFAHIEGGETREAIEDLTGGVAFNLNSRDILNVDRFWKDELSRVNKDRLFACAFDSLDAPSDDPWGGAPAVQGLFGGHAYAVLRAAEVNGKRFVVLRNPWGKSEWTGPWSDGSKEWTAEWLKALPLLKHGFGDDGQFVMEYKDFLQYFTDIDRVLLFDDGWTFASSWLTVPISPIPAAPAYGTLSFRVSIPKKTKAIFVLSRLNSRAFQSLKDEVYVTFEYSVVKVGELVPLATASPARPFTRSAPLEIELDIGEYMVYVKLDQRRTLNPSSDYSDWTVPYRASGYPELSNPSSRVVSKILEAKVKAVSLTQNWDGVGETDYLVKSLEEVIKEDLEKSKSAQESDSESESGSEDESSDDEDDDGSATGGDASKVPSEAGEKPAPTDSTPADGASTTDGATPEGAEGSEEKKVEDGAVGEITLAVPGDSDSESSPAEEPEVSPLEWMDVLESKGEEVALGLRVYTKTHDPALITGRIHFSPELTVEY